MFSAAVLSGCDPGRTVSQRLVTLCCVVLSCYTVFVLLCDAALCRCVCAAVLSVCDPGRTARQRLVVLERGGDGLGFSVVGGHASPHGHLPIYVKTVFERGAAADEGSLRRGDMILSVNGVSLTGATHQRAVQLLTAATGTVTLLVES